MVGVLLFKNKHHLLPDHEMIRYNESSGTQCNVLRIGSSNDFGRRVTEHRYVLRFCQMLWSCSNLSSID